MSKTIKIETKEWNIPEGYEIDREKSNELQIVFKKIEDKVRSWEEYCKKIQGKDSYYVENVNYKVTSSQFESTPFLEEFDNKEDAEAFAALGKLLKLRKQWLADWKPDWTNNFQWKFTIISDTDEISEGVGRTISRSLSFPTEEMRDEFRECFSGLLEVAKPLL